MSKYHGNEHSKAENDNRSNQMNPNNDAYWSSRGYTDEDYDGEDDRIGQGMFLSVLQQNGTCGEDQMALVLDLSPDRMLAYLPPVLSVHQRTCLPGMQEKDLGEEK